MPLYSFEGKSPRINPSAFIAPTATIIGDVTIEENASVWYNAVVRADFSPIVIRRGANIQDCAVLLSEDLQHGWTCGSVTVRNPFAERIEETRRSYAARPVPVSRHRRRGRPKAVAT